MKYLFCLLLGVLPAYCGAQDTLPTRSYNALNAKGYTSGAQIGLFFFSYREPNPSGGYYYYGITQSGLTFQTMHGYRFNPHLAVYGVAELNFYEDVYLLPLMASVRATLRKHRFTPYWAGEAGYALELNNDKPNLSAKTWGGRVFGGEVGIQFPTRQKTAFMFSVGYRNQRMRSEYMSGNNFIERYTTARRAHIRLGMIF
jgi:hypothetical protein